MSLAFFMRFISVASALSICLIILILWPQDKEYVQVNPISEACSFVSHHIFLDDELVRPWHKRCAEIAQQNLNLDLSYQRQQFRLHLSGLNVSHLDLFEPQEVKNIWSENKKSTGILAEFIDGQLIVVEVMPGSSAVKSEVKTGDQILSINQEAPSPHLAQEISGEYIFDRKGQKLTLQIEVSELVVNEKWQVSKISDKTAHLKIPSFRANYFSKEDLVEMSNQLKSYKKIILDLRKNQGGNFVSGLRLLSVFFCGPQSLGYLIRPKFPNLPKVNMPDDLNDENQLDLMNKSYYMNLQSFSNYPCLTQSLSLLVDHETASTSEMVAQALKDYRGARIFGNPSGGKLLVGVWYPMERLGTGVKISVPEAVYQTKRGRQIENNGVHLDEVLDYRREDFEKGVDTWLKNVLSKF